MRIYRLFKGKKWAPALKNGFFVLGDPSAKSARHYQKSEVLVKSEDEVIRLLGMGFSISVETPTRPSLVRKDLFVDGKPV